MQVGANIFAVGPTTNFKYTESKEWFTQLAEAR